MPALFAYILAVAVLLGGGYAGLQWLAEPAPVATHAGKESSKSSKVAEQAHPSADVYRRDFHTRGSVLNDMASKPAAEAAADPQATGDQGKTATAPTESHPVKDDANDAATNAADVPRGGCMPFGITGKGELVFPMECRAILTQDGAGRAVPQSDPADVTPAAKQAETPAEPAEHGEVAPPVRTQEEPPRPESKQDATTEDGTTNPPAGAKPDRTESEPSKTKKVAKQAAQPVHPKGVMMVLRTIEFPDGHREQRLLPMSRWRRMSSRDDPW